MITPYLEPYLIRAMRKVMTKVEDPEVKEDMQRFSAQGGNHYQQHMGVNEVFRKISAKPEAVMALEEKFKNDYESMYNSKSLRFNLAYAEGFEAVTTALSLAMLESGISKNDMSGPVADLMEWHLMEELEHRTVAFDAYEHAGGYFYKLGVSLYAQWHIISSAYSMSKLLRSADLKFADQYNKPGMRRARFIRHVKILSGLIPGTLRTDLPWYNSRQVKVPESFEQLKERYTELAVSHR